MSEIAVNVQNTGTTPIDTFKPSDGTNQRQAMVISSPTTNANVAEVTSGGALKIDGSAVTQPVSGSVNITSPSITNTATLGALNAACTLTMSPNQYEGFSAQLIGSSFVGTVVVEGTIDGTNWTAQYFYVIGTDTQISSSLSNSAAQYIRGNAGGFDAVRIRVSAYTSGSLAVTLQSSNSPGFIPIGALPAGTSQIGSLVPWNYTLVTASGNTVIKNSKGVILGIEAVATTQQSSSFTVNIYDNASTNSGNLVGTYNQLGPGQVITFGASSGAQMLNGITVNCSAAPTGSVKVYWL